MIQTYRRLQQRRAAGEIDGGFTLIELLIVIVVLGILAAIVVFALGGVTGKSAAAACQSDAKTVGVGVAALQAENITLQSNGLTVATWKSDMTSTGTITGLKGNPFVQTWPSSTSYVVWVGDGGTWSSDQTLLLATASGFGIPSTTTVAYRDITGTGSASTIATSTATNSVYGDVYVTGLGSGTTGQAYTFDATTNPIEACNFAVVGKA